MDKNEFAIARVLNKKPELQISYKAYKINYNSNQITSLNTAVERILTK